MDQLPLPENPTERYKFEVLFQSKFQILELNETNIKIKINNQEYHMIKAVAYPIIEQYAYDRIVVGKFIMLKLIKWMNRFVAFRRDNDLLLCKK